MNTSMNALDDNLASRDPSTVLAGAWDALDLGARVADAITWEETSDELLALTAAQECSAARALLPLPGTGRPVPLEASEIQAGPGGLAPYAGLLERTYRALAGLAEQDVQLSEAAEHAAAAARSLAAVRGQ
ncbi:hypothetical protein AB0K64_29110 [Streptomyces sp. NPDC053741]|nr:MULTISPECIES: hypothetical protein [Streptomyces]MCY1655518.1 hypothetical protein [Streptomyces sp. SL203]MCY1677132.1 hypothetical protein [Streptomyces sp. SL294]MDF6066787.1 hypothetical protein [Streptomyces sp. JH010]MDX3186733.1 hypothetical protein [Streptomyces sp. ME02-7008A-1]MDX3307483.1 hypothetical protein [Streptomyces sp. ME02-7008A]